MKVIIAGSRSFNDYHKLKEVCDDFIRLIEWETTDIEIVSGTANGADKLGELYAKEKGYRIKQFPADWNTHGKSAGYIRNEEMAKYADVLIAFWNGESRGTKHMIDLAIKHGLRIEIINTTL